MRSSSPTYYSQCDEYGRHVIQTVWAETYLRASTIEAGAKLKTVLGLSQEQS
jgi:hypothetical protein